MVCPLLQCLKQHIVVLLLVVIHVTVHSNIILSEISSQKSTIDSDEILRNTYQTMKVMERLEADHIFRRIGPLDKSSRFIDSRKR